jgi:RNA polymerase primary sigma factor
MMLAAQRSSHMEVLPDLPDPRNFTAADRSLERDELRQLLARLTERERTVLLAHYGISLGDPATSSPATYEQVARRLGVSKQRVRQIEQVALSKLRAQFEPSVELR